MKEPFYRNLVVVGSIHVVLVLFLAAMALVHGCRRTEPVALTYMPIEFVSEVPAPSPPPPAPKPVPPTPKQKTPRPPKRRPPKRTPPRQTSQAEIRNMLDLNPSKITNVRPLNDDGMYRALIDQTYRRAWKPPSYSEVGDAITLVSLYLRSDGTVIKYHLKGSGNELLDVSVRKAMESVRRIPGLSSDYVGRNKVIPLNFQAER